MSQESWGRLEDVYDRLNNIHSVSRLKLVGNSLKSSAKALEWANHSSTKNCRKVKVNRFLRGNLCDNHNDEIIRTRLDITLTMQLTKLFEILVFHCNYDWQHCGVLWRDAANVEWNALHRDSAPSRRWRVLEASLRGSSSPLSRLIALLLLETDSWNCCEYFDRGIYIDWSVNASVLN